MRIMWIEDELASEKGEFFKPVINKFDIEIAHSVSEADEIIKNKLRNYDYIIIDINLTSTLVTQPDQRPDWVNNFIVSQINSKEKENNKIDTTSAQGETSNCNPLLDPELVTNFYKQAGLALFMRLIAKGFPKDRIVFLTGNAKDELEQYNRECKSHFIEPPRGFYKDDEGKNEFYKWLSDTFINTKSIVKRTKTKTTYPEYDKYCYLALRRGIMNVVTYLIEKEEAKAKKEWNSNHFDKEIFLNNLKYIVSDHYIPSAANSKHAYLAICDAIVKPFERFEWKDFFSKDRSYTKDEDKVKNKHLVYPAYFLRNWISHGVIRKSGTVLDAHDSAFIFLIVIQEIFEVFILDPVYDFNKEFSDLLSFVVDKNDVENRIGQLENDYKEDNDPLWQINRKGFGRITSDDYRIYVYASFLFPLRLLHKKGEYQQEYRDSIQKQGLNGYFVPYFYKFEMGDNERVMSQIALSRLEKIKR